MIMISRLQPLFNILLSFHARGFALMGKKRKKDNNNNNNNSEGLAHY